MLCPKCGFISFDHLSDCGKCHNDLSGIGAELRGTAADVEGHFFLGSLIKDDSGRQALSEEAAIFSTLEPPQDAEEIAAFGEETVTIDQGAAVQEEELLFSADESPALEFDLDEIPHLESSEGGLPAGAEPPDAELPLPTEVESSLLALNMGEGAGAAPAAAQVEEVADRGEAEIDFSSLNLVSSEEVALAPEEEPSELDSQTGQRTIDLDSIDLSDLVHHEEEAAAEPSGIGAAGEGAEFDDTVDLSLFVGDANPAQPAEPSRPADANELRPIDLTLVDDALVDLVSEPGGKEEDVAKKDQQEIMELSMEGGDK